MKKEILSESRVLAGFILLTICMVIIAMTTGCNKDKKAEATEKVEAAFAVNTYTTTEGRLDDYLEFGGDVVASSVVNIIPDTNGKISKIRVSVGDFVKRDQIVAYVDPSKPGMNYAESPVRSPVSGTITSFPYVIGTTVGPQSAIGQISSTANLEIQTNIAERFVSRIRNGQKASVSFDAFPGETFTAVVFEVSPVLDTTTRTMRVKLRIDPADDRVKSGMYARVRLITDQIQNAIIVPYDALIIREGKSYVFTVQRTGTPIQGQTGFPGIAHLTEIREGIHVDDKQEILSGLSSGQEIVTRGQSLLNDGSKVNIITTVNETSK
ncbi:MAG: efflux RND transporter periplasmic adaptor subunit [Treponema sp.]|nr:efflux RND transporter periplasmic adaptor subunit [Treponema sp.]